MAKITRTRNTSTDLLTYVSGFAIIENNIVASNIPITLVIEKQALNPRTQRKYLKEYKKVKGTTSLHGKYDFNIKLPEGEYFMYVIFDDNRIGKPDAYAYYGISNKINLEAGGRKGFDISEIKKVAKPIEKIVLSSVLLPDLDIDSDGCEWKIEEKVNGVIVSTYNINQVIEERFMGTETVKKMALAKTGNNKTPFEFLMGNKYEFIFSEMNGDVGNPNDNHSGIIEIDARNKNFIISNNWQINIIDVKDRYLYAVTCYSIRSPYLHSSWSANLEFIYK